MAQKTLMKVVIEVAVCVCVATCAVVMVVAASGLLAVIGRAATATVPVVPVLVCGSVLRRKENGVLGGRGRELREGKRGCPAHDHELQLCG